MNNEKIKNLSEKLTQLINTSLKNKEEWATRTSFLFQQKERLKNILDLADNPVILNAYLTLQGFKYLAQGVMSVEKLLKIIEQEIELSEENIKKWEELEFMNELETRIKKGGKIKWEAFINGVENNTENKLETEIPNLTEKILKKHHFKKEREDLEKSKKNYEPKN